MPPKIVTSTPEEKGGPSKSPLTIQATNGFKYVLSILTAPVISNDREFLAYRISDAVLDKILIFFNNNKQRFLQQIRTESDPKKALHLKSIHYPDKLPRNIIIYQNSNGELRCLIPLKAKLSNGDKILAIDGGVNPGHINAGGFRSVKYVVDLHTKELYAETINKGTDLRQQSTELELFQKLNSDYLNAMVCYTQYINSHGRPVTVTISPYYKHGTLGANKMKHVSDKQKLRIVLQLLFGVKDIHDLEYCHNDLKPGNILIKNDLVPLIIDLDGVTRHQPIIPHAICTPAYRAPETYNAYSLTQLIPEGTLASHVVQKYPKACEYSYPFNHKANDIWALGIIIYQMIHDDEFPRFSFLEQDRDKITKRKITAEYTHEKLFLELLSYSCLRPQRADRLNINELISLMFYCLAKSQIQLYGWQIFTARDGEND